MGPNDALMQLRDIHMPEPIGVWPLAPGWYVVAAIVIISVVWCYGRYRRNRLRRRALALLDGYLLQYQREGNRQASAASVSLLLKQVALLYFPRDTVAGLQGELWLQFLANTSKKLDMFAVRRELLEVPYQAAADGDMLLLFRTARLWISQRRGRCLN